MTQNTSGSLIIRGEELPIQPGKIHPKWHDAAKAKGYRVVARVKDKNTLALECETCGNVHASRYYVLMNFQPECPHCIEARWQETAREAGFELLRRDPQNRHYAFYRAPCGHEVRRQFGSVLRVARGVFGPECDACQEARDREDARARGWDLVGADPKGKANYRIYRHADGCGALSRITRGNMVTGSFTCPGCGEGWSTEPSYLYAMRFELQPGKHAVKLGYSRIPESRLNYQLHRDPELPRELLCKVPMRTGRHAQRIEKRAHKWLTTQHPGMELPHSEFAAYLRVKSELYRAELEPVILRLLDRIARKEARAATKSFARQRSRSKRMRDS